jgi:Eukaryotic aspartyl protease
LNIFIIGDAFLRSFYNIYDFENQRVGLALHKWTTATIDEESNLWIYLIIIGSVIFIIIAVACYIKKRRAAKEEET